MTDENVTASALRELWDGQGSSRAEVEEALGEARTCRNMKHVNFDSMAEPGTDLGAAWRDKLRREGKLSDDAGSLGDLIRARVAGEPTTDLDPAPHG
jgi:hypothetical protein